MKQRFRKILSNVTVTSTANFLYRIASVCNFVADKLLEIEDLRRNENAGYKEHDPETTKKLPEYKISGS